MAEGVPIFRGIFGVSHGQQAVQIDERINRGKRASALAVGPR
jgi:flagellar motor switch protein FliM